ncbi:MAG: tripartite tricarboxylate transporter TctB family protein [Rhizobiales bacterium]|nr:tripartite tricarboxylate transporter TctB family protein [Hyphomicrobiales bacterium]
MAEPRARKPGETTFNVLLFLASLFLAWQAYKISGFSALSSTGAFPMAAAGVMVVSALIVLIGDLGKSAVLRGYTGKASAFFGDVAPPVILIFTAMVIAYAVLFDQLGFLPTSLLFLIAAIQFLKGGNPLINIVIAVGALIVIYVVFRLIFTVVLPEGIVPEREIMAWIGRLVTGGSAE